ncbi:MAG TPA: PDZ domain-containing protein, partial [Burkholderiaceae bacterium]|nr:PDZ domain-containing protein [Burkholderiaceae bacterium]
MRRRLLLPLICGLLAACAGTPSTPPARPTAPRPAAPAQRPPDPAVLEEARKQAEFAFRQRAQEVTRLYSLFWPLTRAAAPLCEGRSLASIGPSPGTLLAVGEASRPELRRMLGMDERLTFIVVVDNTPAARAGIKAGDILLAVDDQPIAPSPEASRQYNERLAAAATRGAPAELLLERKGQQQRVSVPVERVCAGSIQALTNDVVGAYASGRTIGVTRGMLRFADDRELAIVIGHELAHIALGHTQPPQPPIAQATVPAVPAVPTITTGIHICA